jgi:flavin-binding protein dodecin
MDALLKLAANAGVEVSAAEEALEEGAHAAARDALDRAEDALAALRERWPQMTAAERTLIGEVAAAVRSRRDAVAARVPAARPLSEGLAELDPEQERAPDDAAA